LNIGSEAFNTNYGRATHTSRVFTPLQFASIALTCSTIKSSMNSTETSSSSDSSYGQKQFDNNSKENVSFTESNERILDLDQPFLLYKAYSSRQVLAHTLDASAFCMDAATFQKTGPSLLIPENYTGWFSLVNSRGQTAGYFSTIDEVAKAQVPYFLTKDEITAHLVSRENPALNTKVNTAVKTNRNNYESIRIKGGTVLRLLGVYEDISALVIGLKNRSSLRSKKIVPTEPGARYAKCISFTSFSGGEIVFIPITEIGRFYVVCKRLMNNPSYNHVYTLDNLLRLVKFPVTVQLVIGPKPRNYISLVSTCKSDLESNKKESSMFSAILHLEDIRVRDVILGCTLRPQPIFRQTSRERNSLSSSLRRTLRGNRSENKSEETPILLEFDLDSNFTFVRTFVEKNGTLSSRKIPELVVQRIAFCNAEAEFWRRQIKISHDVTPKTLKSPSTLKNQRKSILDEEFQKKFDKTASIGSRTSSNISNVSRISRILQKFWGPLKKSNRKIEDELSDEIADTEENGKVNSIVEKLPKLSNNSVSASTIADYHFYETLRKVDEKSLPSKQKLCRKQTLDVIFPDFKLDKGGYVLASQKITTDEKK
ncbi:uncharacterized protein B4U79_11846, partial [Dinothrombium tinctorium]